MIKHGFLSWISSEPRLSPFNRAESTMSVTHGRAVWVMCCPRAGCSADEAISTIRPHPTCRAALKFYRTKVSRWLFALRMTIRILNSPFLSLLALTSAAQRQKNVKVFKYHQIGLSSL